MIDRSCSVLSCDKPAKTRGKCHTHYMQWYRGEGRVTEKKMGRPTEPPKPCLVETCERPARAHLLCAMHYRRWRRTGEPLGLTIEQQFFLHVTESSEGCWIWDKPKPYGQFTEGGKNHLAHRWIYRRMVTDIPEGLQIDHLCRNRACVNPYHLDPVPGEVNNARSNSPSAVNARKTHCRHGHAFDDDNTRRTPDGERQCRACRTPSVQMAGVGG